MRTTRITGPDGRVTVIQTRSRCGCLTAFLAVFVVAGPAALFPGPLAVAAYVALGVITTLACIGWLLQNRRQAAPQPPPAPVAPPPPLP